MPLPPPRGPLHCGLMSPHSSGPIRAAAALSRYQVHTCSREGRRQRQAARRRSRAQPSSPCSSPALLSLDPSPLPIPFLRTAPSPLKAGTLIPKKRGRGNGSQSQEGISHKVGLGPAFYFFIFFLGFFCFAGKDCHREATAQKRRWKPWGGGCGQGGRIICWFGVGTVAGRWQGPEVCLPVHPDRFHHESPQGQALHLTLRPSLKLTLGEVVMSLRNISN